MFLDIAPGGRKKGASAAQIRRLQRGGKRADVLQKMSRKHHAESEVPRAERQLLKSLGELPTKLIPKKKKTDTKKEPWWVRIWNFFFSS